MFLVDGFIEHFIEHYIHMYPVARDTRPLTSDEHVTYAKQVLEAETRELQSWIDNKTGRPQLIAEYCKETNLRPVPARRVTEFKRKLAELIVKARMCLKGFAEANQGAYTLDVDITTP